MLIDHNVFINNVIVQCKLSMFLVLSIILQLNEKNVNFLPKLSFHHTLQYLLYFKHI